MSFAALQDTFPRLCELLDELGSGSLPAAELERDLDRVQQRELGVDRLGAPLKYTPEQVHRSLTELVAAVQAEDGRPPVLVDAHPEIEGRDLKMYFPDQPAYAESQPLFDEFERLLGELGVYDTVL